MSRYGLSTMRSGGKTHNNLKYDKLQPNRMIDGRFMMKAMRLAERPDKSLSSVRPFRSGGEIFG